MKFDPEILRQLMLMFKAELEEQSQVMTDGLLTLEKGVSGELRKQCLERIFRAAHNIKGAARGIDAQDVASIAHALETMFSKFQREELKVTAQSITSCLLGIDRMRQSMAALESGQAVDFNLQELLGQLNNRQDEAHQAVSRTESEPEPETKTGIDHPVELKSEAVQAAGAGTGAVDSGSNAPPAPAAAAPAGDSSAVLDSGTTRIPHHRLDQFSILVEDLMISKIEMEEHLNAIKQLYDETQGFSREWIQNQQTFRKMRTATQDERGNNLLETTTAGLNRFRISTQHLYKQMRDSHTRCSLTFSQLLDQVRALHLVSAAVQLQPLARLVRDLALELGKKVDLAIIGDDIEMDRPILEGIKDPLIHLLRNAIDHGIENPKERLAAGKPEAGRLTITVSKADDRILITIDDDGSGIDADRIARHAVKKNLLTQHEVMNLSKTDIINLIFRPGFSSKEIITDISGRGVGLDVVLTNIHNLKGYVRVDTVPGQGTAFVLNLPLTLSTDRGLLVRVEQLTFAIPISMVERVMEVAFDDLTEIGGSQAILIENQAIPVRDLAAILEIGKFQSDPAKRIQLVIVAKGWQRAALLVEEIISEREIVIKRLKPPLKSVRNVLGATFMGNNEVIIVLDPNDLVASALHLGGIMSLSRQKETAENESSRPHILVVDDSITIRTFEKTLLEIQGYQVTVAVDGQNAWDLLQQQSFDLVITDVEMPMMNGFELCERIKYNQKLEKLPVIIVTSLDSETEKQRGIEAGANAYIVKNQFESRVLLDVINQLI